MTKPTQDQVNERLAKLDGWTDIKLYHIGSLAQGVHGLKPPSRKLEPIPDYYHSPAEALRVAEKFNFWDLQKQEDGTYLCYVDDENGAGESGRFVEADTPAAAIALACYQVLEEEENGHRRRTDGDSERFKGRTFERE